MPFFGHLDELRTRLVRASIAIAIGVGLAFFVSEHIISWMSRPLSQPLIFTSPAEAFWANLKVALLGGILLASPAVLYQVWKFLEPGLYPHERKLGLAFVTVASLLFLMGMAFCAWVVFPFTIGFFLGYKTGDLTPMLAIGSYIDFAVKLFLAFGLIFELPPTITLLAKMGIVTPESLRKQRKYAVLGAFVVAAVLTPTPDVFNQCLMVVPLLVLYELGILCAQWFGRRQEPTAESDDTDLR